MNFKSGNFIGFGILFGLVGCSGAPTVGQSAEGNRAVAQTLTADQCPSQIVLSGIDFLGSEHLPDVHQIKTNFDQHIVSPVGHPIWRDFDVEVAQKFIAMIRENYKSQTTPAGTAHAVILTPTFNKDQVCGGTFGSHKLSYVFDGRVRFSGFDSINQVDITIPIESPAVVRFQVHWPSNCSNCGEVAPLFNFKTVSAYK